MTYTVLKDNQSYLENITIRQFMDYIEDTDEYKNWLVINNYQDDYGRRLMGHFLYTYDRCIYSYPYGFTWLCYEFIPEEIGVQ